MHRGSSKDGRSRPGPSETLPLSASPGRVRVEVEVVRAGTVRRASLELDRGALVRDAVRGVGQSPEGSAVMIDERPVPLDLPLEAGVRLVVVPTFSGG